MAQPGLASRPILTTLISSGVSPVDIVLNCKPKADPSALPHRPDITEWAVHAGRTEHFGTLEKHAPGPRGRNDMSKLKTAPRDERLVPDDLVTPLPLAAAISRGVMQVVVGTASLGLFE